VISGSSHSAISILYGVLSFSIVLSLIAAIALRGTFEIVFYSVLSIETLALTVFALTRKVLT
ncbi:MAG TPA: hypothetical protein VK612_13580, partial [Pyrinomonadaceae bacterium]|nr:hypothetical protein [Pyrinomonadaceae bacterium]